MNPPTLSNAEARRIALAAQGFDRPRPKSKIGRQHIRRVIKQLGLLQLDYVNVLIPAHYQVLFSRLGNYEPKLLDSLVYQTQEFTEQWAHEASILPMETWPLFRYRMDAFGTRTIGLQKLLEKHPDYLDWVLEEIGKRGPLSADDLAVPEGVSRRIPGSWVGTVPRAALETLFGRGRIASAYRKASFARGYDLLERAIPEVHLERRLDRRESQIELMRIAARSQGIGTAKDLADYFRLSVPHARLALDALVRAGELERVAVRGWRHPAYLDPEAKRPRTVSANRLLSPFDPLVWTRERIERLFDFYYRLEIFMPEHQRKWGYYVLPFLMGDRIVARVDLRSERKRGRLRVLAAYREDHADSTRVARALLPELQLMATWLGFGAVEIGRKGNLASELSRAARS